MNIKEMRTQTVYEVVDVICNKCGSSLKSKVIGNYYGITSVCVERGYGSSLGDGDDLWFSLCEDCCVELFKTFKHQLQPTCEY